MELGISSYTYPWAAGVPGYPAPSRPLTFESLLDRATALGVTVLQVADNMPLDRLSRVELDCLRERAETSGVRLEVGARGIRPEILLPYIQIAIRLGAPILRTLLDGPSLEPSEREAGELLKQIAPELERARVKLAVENHDRFKATSLRRIVERAASDHIGICLDTANSLGCGETVDQVLDTLADFVINLHIKDFSVQRLPHNKGFIVEGTPAGQGLLDIPAMLARVGGTSREMSAILEQWPPPEATANESAAKEEAWATEGIRYLRTLIPGTKIER